MTDTDRAKKETETRHQASNNNPAGELAKNHNERNARSPTEEDSGSGCSDPPRSPTDVGAAEQGRKTAFEEAEIRKADAAELGRKAAFVEAEIHKVEDYVGQAEQDIGREERRLEKMVKEERMVWEGDRRTREKMETLYRAIELTRHGVMAQRREANNMTREAAGQGIAEARARAMGQGDRGRVKEQVEEKLHLAELMDKDAVNLDKSAGDIKERVKWLQVRINRYDQIKTEQRRQVAELGQEVKKAKLEVAARRQDAYQLEALREVLRWREEECNQEKDRHNIETRQERHYHCRGHHRQGHRRRAHRRNRATAGHQAQQQRHHQEQQRPGHQRQGHRRQGHQRRQLLPSGRSQTGGGPRLHPQHISAEHRCRWFPSTPSKRDG